ncbi:unnamed protein product [Linum tenue]|uniref:DUF1421 domain-containing protein n=1 Tax=Linum tenue TaxID=586396 RepID=A0AAV0MN50_9ROSI|nr:unnamed protein product [Linum tenue]
MVSCLLAFCCRTAQGWDSAERFDDFDLIAEMNRRMDEHAAALLRSVESLSRHVSRMEIRTRQLEGAFDDLRDSMEFYQGKTGGQLQKLQSILTEVQDGVKDLRDKQDIAVAQLHLAEIHKSKDVSQSTKRTNTVQSCSGDQLSSSMAQQFHQPPSNSFTNTRHQGSTELPTAASQPPLLPPGNFHTPASTSPHYTVQPPYNASIRQHEYFPPLPDLPSETSNQLVRFPQTEQLQPSFYAQQPHQEPPLTMANPQSNYPSSPHPGLAPLSPSHGRSFHRQQSNRGSGSELSPAYRLGASPLPSGRPTMKSWQPVQSSSMAARESDFSGLPTAQLLPRAIPTASAIEPSSGSSSGNVSRVPVDDVVDKVVAMGFRRDLVRATVKKLTENGKAVDLNVVLDKLMTSG